MHTVFSAGTGTDAGTVQSPETARLGTQHAGCLLLLSSGQADFSGGTGRCGCDSKVFQARWQHRAAKPLLLRLTSWCDEARCVNAVAILHRRGGAGVHQCSGHCESLGETREATSSIGIKDNSPG